MTKLKKDTPKLKLQQYIGGATEVDEDGQTDTDYNEELEDEYEDVDQENDAKSTTGGDEEYDSDENIDGDENVDAEEEIGEDVDEDDPEIGEDVDIDENAQTIEESDGCMYNFAKKKTDYDSDDDFDDIVFDDEIVVPTENNNKIITGDDRISGSRMTKYERVRILAERAKQLMGGAKHMLKGTDGMSVKEIARAELNMGVIPYKVRRERPDGKIEEWKISELEIGN